MSMNCVEDPFNMGTFLQTKDVIQYGYVFRFLTHTSGHFHIGVAPLGTIPRAGGRRYQCKFGLSEIATCFRS